MVGLRAAAYCRVSTNREEQRNSLDNQRKFFEKFISGKEEWTLVEVFYDEGISGTEMRKREGFNAMMRKALEGKFDLIITKEVSRFARNTVDTLTCTRKLKAQGIGVLFILDNICTLDADGELRLTLMASMAQEESRKTSERVKWGQKRRMEAGVVFGRKLLGYSLADGKLFLAKDEARLVRSVFNHYTNDGMGAYQIAKKMQMEMLGTGIQFCWSAASVLRILKNEKYAGDLLQKKSITPDFLTHQKVSNDGREDKVYICDHHEAIIDRTLWERTQIELERRSRLGKEQKKYSNRHWCSGKLQCGKCGKNLVLRVKRYADGGVYRAWRCPMQDCERRSWNERLLCDVMECCLHFLEDEVGGWKENIRKKLRRLHEQETAASMEQLQLKKTELETKKSRLLELFLEQLLSKEEWKVQRARCDQRIEQLETRMREWIPPAEKEQAKSLYGACVELLEGDKTQFHIYRESLEKISVGPGNALTVYLKGLNFGICFETETYGKREGYTTMIKKAYLRQK